MPPRLPTEADFEPIRSSLAFSVHFPDPPESTRAFLLLFHGLGDTNTPFSRFATNLSLPSVLAISIRAPHALPPYLLDAPPSASAAAPANFHWGDDVAIDSRTGHLDPDPGFGNATRLVWDKLVLGTIVERCGWSTRDVLALGFGQGGSFALGLAARAAAAAAAGARVITEVRDGETEAGARERLHGLRGVVSVGGGLPRSMVSSVCGRERSRTRVLLVQVEEDEVGCVEEEFANVKALRWKSGEVRMPASREEMYPVMQFFAERLAAETSDGWMGPL